ncbi:MAG: hypothetical protein ACKOQS_08435 [Dolichospermum sp.]
MVGGRWSVVRGLWSVVISYSKLSSNPEQEPHPQLPPISKVYPFLPAAAGGLRRVRGGG